MYNAQKLSSGKEQQTRSHARKNEVICFVDMSAKEIYESGDVEGASRGSPSCP